MNFNPPVNPDLRQRIRTAIFLIAAVLIIGISSLYWCFFHWLLFDLAVLSALISSYEYVRFSQQTSGRFGQILSALLYSFPTLLVAYGVTVLGLCENLGGYSPLVELSVLGFFISFTGMALACLRNASLAAAEIARDFGERTVALVFLGFSSTYLLILAAEPDAFLGIAWFIAVVASNDSIAYFAGRRFGRHALALAVSPKKTLEGSAAGLLGAMVVGALLGLLLLPEGRFMNCLALAGLVVVAAQVGDLTKSLLKRIHNTKDSGSLLPGHGGVLDRIDGLIGAAPVFYLLRDWFVG